MKSIIILIHLAVFNLGIISAGKIDAEIDYSFAGPKDYNVLSSIQDTSMLVRPFQLDIVAPSSGVQFYRNEILFLSYSKSAVKMTEKHLSFGTLRPFTTAVSDTVPGDYLPFISSTSIVFPTDATTFSEDHNTMYLSMIPERKSKEKIFCASSTQNGWVIESSPLSFCNDNNIYTHPALSEDGQFLIFSSDKSGSAGGLDLFVSRKENDKWTEPENLGPMINTSGNELFASLDNENNLYFSSDGLPGLGGYDIFMSNYNGKNWSKPANLTSAINSQNDEVAFKVNPVDSKSAFFTMRAKSSINNAQLFRVTLKPAPASGQSSNLTSSFLALTGLTRESQHPVLPSMALNNATIPENKVADPIGNVQTKKETGQAVQTAKAETPIKTAEIKPETKVEPKVETKNVPLPGPKVETKPVPAEEVAKGVVLYRVQVLANTKPVGSYDLTVAGKSYKTFEYLYAGAYRTTVGEFSNLTEAVSFQNTCRKSGYSQAFIVAFRDNIRTNDPALFKK